MQCSSAKSIWDKVQSIYKGDDTVKKAKLQTYRGQFEALLQTNVIFIKIIIIHVLFHPKSE